MWSLMPSFGSHSPTCNPIDSDWVAMETWSFYHDISLNFKVSQRMLIRLQIQESEMTQGINWHISRKDHVAIR